MIKNTNISFLNKNMIRKQYDKCTLMPFKSLHIAIKKSSKTLEVKKVQRDITVVVNSKYNKE